MGYLIGLRKTTDFIDRKNMYVYAVHIYIQNLHNYVTIDKKNSE